MCIIFLILILGTSNSGPHYPTVDNTMLISHASEKSLNLMQDSVDFTKVKEEIICFDRHQTKNVTVKSTRNQTVVNGMYQAKVLLKNIYPYLECTGHYCSQCLILFSDKTAFNSHRVLLHRKDSKEFYLNDLQCHLSQVHQVKQSMQVQYVETWNPHTKKITVMATANVPQETRTEKNTDTESRENYTCFHCNMLFVTQKALIEHLYNVMQLKKINNESSTITSPDSDCVEIDTKSSPDHNSVKINTKTIPYRSSVKINTTPIKEKSTVNSLTKINEKDEIKKNNVSITNELEQSMFYKCNVCSFYFETAELCSRHILAKHGVNKKVFKTQPFVTKCVFCQRRKTNIDEYNIHIFAFHRKQYNKNMKDSEQTLSNEQKGNNESRCERNNDSFVFRATLFKCLQCDIHFLTAKAAHHHAEHMELLINWKCYKCNRIFKKNDEYLHEYQHKFSNEFTVHDLNTSAYSRVLYNCSKCTIHFTEEKFLTHYPICNFETPSSIYCNICDVLIDENTMKSHKMIHIEDESLNFIIIETDIVSINSESAGVKRKSNEERYHSPSKKKKDSIDDFHNLFYCDTCHSFVNKQHNGIHKKAQCIKFQKNICQMCGLVFTNRCFLVHKLLHSKFKTLTFQDFTFCELKTNKQICPPMPEYFKCNICNVTFISQLTLMAHGCGGEDYLTCPICEKKLSDDVFRLHTSFHNYSIANTVTDVRPEDGAVVKDQTSRVSEIPTVSDLFQSKSDLKSSSLLKSSQVLFPKKTCSARIKKYGKKNTVELVPVIFSCKNCGITVDTYDKMIEHCHSHYKGCELKINTDDSFCPKCNLKFDKSCYGSHEKLHQENTDFKVLNFDTYYFTSANEIWLKHVFGSMPQSLIDKIVNNSTYRWECRVKMRVIQEGPPHLTIYKCEKCLCFVDQLAVYKHPENSCFKLRCEACSFCSIPFISSFTRSEHEKHHATANLTVKSYRIVSFNRKEDLKLNNLLCNRKLYPLYLCRNCNGVTDKYQLKNHKCDIYNLKECLECGLLLCGAEFETHSLKHKELCNFTQKNIKVLLFGDKTKGTKSIAKFKSSFSGVICDYSYYRCSNCQGCVKKTTIVSHVCSAGLTMTHCQPCDLYFAPSKFKDHYQLHDDPDFMPENVTVFAFDPQLKVVELNKTKFKEPAHKVYSNGYKNNGVMLKTTKIYKCNCGLHFLDAISISTHMNCCNPKLKKWKQNCSKCNLLFSSDILFAHLLKHHGDKKHKYKFEIVDLTCDKDFTNILYRCPTCKLHFVNGKEASEHLTDCKHRNLAGKQCNNCNLFFNEACFNIHIQNNCDNSRVGNTNNIYEFKKCSIPLEKID